MKIGLAIIVVVLVLAGLWFSSPTQEVRAGVGYGYGYFIQGEDV